MRDVKSLEMAMRRGSSWQHRFCSTNAQTQGEAAKSAITEGMSTRTRVILFSLVVGLSGFGVFCYQLVADREFLISVNDKVPGVIRFLGPYLGLPVASSSDYGDSGSSKQGELEFPPELKDIVGETLKIRCLMRSGQVVLVDADAEAALTTLNELANAKLGNLNDSQQTMTSDVVVNYEVVNREDEEGVGELKGSAFQLQIPVIPVDATIEQKKRILLECEMLLNEVNIQIELSKKYGNDYTSSTLTKQQLEDQVSVLRKDTSRSWSLW